MGSENGHTCSQTASVLTSSSETAKMAMHLSPIVTGNETCVLLLNVEAKEHLKQRMHTISAMKPIKFKQNCLTEI
jgi:hypothetical protein